MSVIIGMLCIVQNGDEGKARQTGIVSRLRPKGGAFKLVLYARLSQLYPNLTRTPANDPENYRLAVPGKILESL